MSQEEKGTASISPASRNFRLLQQRLDSAEIETQDVMKQLSQWSAVNKVADKSSYRHPIAPFRADQATNYESSTLMKDYERLVGKVCRLESSIQSIKLNLCSLEAEKLRRDGGLHLEDTQRHEEEIKRLTKELSQYRRQCKEAVEARQAAQDAVQRIRSALDVANVAKVNIASELEETKMNNIRTMKRLAEVTEYPIISTSY